MLTDVKVAAVKAPSSGQKEYPDNKVTGLRLRVGSGGTKTWIYRARAGSRMINKKLGTYPGMKLADAREAALKAVEAIARSGSAEVLERTFGALAEHWIKYVAKPKNDSWKNQERTLERHVLPRWRDRKVADIRRAEVRDLVEGLEGVVLPNRVLALVKTILRYALSRIEPLAAMSLEQMPAHDGITWLDEDQSRARAGGAPGSFGAKVADAIRRRQQWLVERGLADKPNMLDILRRRELMRVAGQLSRELGVGFAEAESGIPIEGIYRRSVQVGTARMALIENSHEFTLVPWRPVLERRLGKQVAGIMRGAEISWRFGRERSGPEI